MNLGGDHSRNTFRPSRVSLLATLLLLYALAVAGYAVLRYRGQWTETDTATLTNLIEVMREQATIRPAGLAYPHGFAYQVVSLAVLSAIGLPVQALQTTVYPFLAVIGLVLTSLAFFTQVTGDRRVAILASLSLFFQPDVMFVTLRGSHEKFTRKHGLGITLASLALGWVGAQPPHVIDDVGPGIQGGLRHAGFVSVYGNERVGFAANGANDRRHARGFFFGADGLRAGAGGFAAHIQNITPGSQEGAGLLKGIARVGLGKQAIARETIWRDVEDAHHIRARAPLQGVMANDQRLHDFRQSGRAGGPARLRLRTCC